MNRRVFQSLSIFLMFLMTLVLVPIHAQADTFEDFTYTVSGGEAEITAYNGTAEILNIPETLGGYPVVRLADNAFNSPWLTQVTIPKFVSAIGEQSFTACSNLNKIVAVDDNPYLCSLNDVLFDQLMTTLLCYPASKTDASYTAPASLVNIRNYAFYYNAYLGSVNFSTGLLSIGDFAFSDCYNLKNVVLPGTLTNIGNSSFAACGLTGISIPNSVLSIGELAFSLCGDLTSVNIPANVNSIGTGAFSSCKALAAVNVDSGNLTFSSLSGVLYNKTKTQLLYYPVGKTSASFIIPGSVTQIGSAAFAECLNLKEVTLPTGVTEIGSSAFYYCEGLTAIVIPASVQIIGDNAFQCCTYLSAAYFWGDAPVAGSGVFDYCAQDFCIYYLNTHTGFAVLPWTSYPVSTFTPLTVTFNTMGGSSLAPLPAIKDFKITAPATPVKSGYSLAGWYKDSNYTSPWDFAIDQVSADMTLYARWIPSMVSNLKAASSSYNSVKLSWTSVSGVSGYAVYRASTASGSYTLLASTVLTNTYSNTSLTCGTTYYYKVRAYVQIGATRYYNNYSLSASARPLPPVPGSFKAASASYNSIKLTWNTVTGASGYGIYRAASSSGPYIGIKNITSGSTTSYINSSLSTGTTYYYIIRAYRLVNSVKIYGPSSAYDKAMPVPAAPGSFTAKSASYNSIRLTWSAPAGASGYAIFVSTAAAGPFQYIKNITSGSTTSYTHTSLATGKTLYYKIRAYRLVGTVKIYGSYAPVVSAKPVPSVPASLTVTRYSSTSIKVSWTAVSGASGYEVYRATSSAGPFTWVRTTTSTSWLNSGLVAGRRYYYKVRAYRLVGTTRVYGSFTTAKYA